MITAPTGRRPLLRRGALLLVAVVGLLAATGNALGPVEQDEHVHSYRPADFDEDGLAVAPLALAREAPDELEIVLPCGASDTPSRFRSLDLDIWASTVEEQRSTLRFLPTPRTLEVTVSEGRLSVLVGSDEVLEVTVGGEAGCSARIQYEDGVWLASAGDSEITAEGSGPRFGEAAFSGPAAASEISSVTVRTRELGSSPSPVQFLLLGVAVLALLTVGREIWARGSQPAGDGGSPTLLARARRSVRIPDFVVLGGLVAWIFLIPLNIDDGWIAARVGSYAEHGDIAGLFTVNSAPMPFGYWLEWLQHLWLSPGTQPLLMRLPGVLIGVVTWFGLRSIGRSVGLHANGGSVWVMAGAFLVGFGAWGITVRAEPVIAAFVIASIALALRFGRGERGGVVVAWIAVVALAATAHPAGIIVAAPMLVSWRSLWDWGRESRDSAYVAVTAVVALAATIVLIFFFDSSLTTKFDSIEAYRTDAHSLSVLDEFDRYEMLGETPYATPMRRATVVLILTAAGSFLLARRRDDAAVSLPGWSLLVALVLLTLTPSKWPWHLGGLLALSALVLAIALSRMRAWRAWIAVGGIAGGMAWAWARSLGWAPFDLRIQEWFPGAGNVLPLTLSSPATWAFLAILVGGGWVVWSRWRGASRWTAPEVFTLVAVGLVIIVTGSTLALDTARSDGWTLGRQNFESLAGSAGCGLGEEVEVPVRGSLHALLPAAEQASADADEAAAESGFAGGGPFDAAGYPADGINQTLPLAGMGIFGSWLAADAGGPQANTGSHRSEWHAIEPGDEVVAVMVLGRFSHSRIDNEVGVQWGRSDGLDVVDLGSEVATGLSGYFLDWRIVEFDPPQGADRVRTLVRDETSDVENAWLAASAPLGFETATVAEVAGDGTAILASPALAPYFPCVGVPGFEAGVVPAPEVMIQTWREMWQTTYAHAVASDRYLRIDVDTDPPLESIQIGAHTGDVDNFVFVSQEYLTGVPSRINGAFERDGG